MSRHRLGAAGAALLLTTAVSAGAQRAVTRDQAIAAAVAHGPALAVAAADTTAARAALIGARSYPNPALSVSATRDYPRGHAAADLPLDFPWLRHARIASAEAARASVLDRFALQRAAIAFDAETTYVNAMVADARARLSRDNARDADSLQHMAELRRQAGDASDLDVELATIAAGRQDNLALGDSLTAVAALLDLQTVMGEPGDRVTIRLADSLALSDTTPVSEGTPYAVRAAREAVTAADEALTTERRRVWGSASVQLGADFDDNSQAGLLPVVGLAIPLPLFDRNGSGVVAARAQRDRARAQLRLVELESRRDVARAQEARAIALQRVARDRTLLASADRVARMALTAYREGASPLAAVLQAQASARDTFAQYVADVGEANVVAATLRLLTASAPRIP